MTSALQQFTDRIARLERNMRAGQSKPQLGTSSIENGGAIKDRGPDGTTYQFIGRQFDGTHTVSQVNGPTPPAPTSPGASWLPGGINVSWDGMFETGPIAPMDLLRVDVHILDDEHADPLLYQPAGTLLAGAGGTSSVLLEPGEYWAVLVAWTTSGKYAVSQPSNEVIVEDFAGPTGPPPTDALAPVEAPVVTGQPFGVGGVEFQWQTIINPDEVPDPIYYRYWASFTPDVDDSGPETGWVPQPNVRISSIDGVQVPIDGSATVYIKVAAYDSDGEGPVSAEASATPDPADVETFLAAFIGALEIEASQIRGQFISADLALLTALQVGDRLEIDGATSVITIFATQLDEAGERIPLIQLDPDGSTFRGRVIADDVSVLHGLILQGDLSQIAENAGLTIMAGVGSPNIGPGLSSALKTATWPAVPTNWLERGAAWDPDEEHYVRLLVPAPGQTPAVGVAGNCKVERIAEDGTVLSEVTLDNISGLSENDMNSIVAYGGEYIVMAGGTDGGKTFWDIAKFSSDGTFLMTTPDMSSTQDSTFSPCWGFSSSAGNKFHTGLGRPALGLWRRATDSSFMLVTAVWSDSSEATLQPTTGANRGPGLYVQRRRLDTLEWNSWVWQASGPLDSSSSAGKTLSFAKAYGVGTTGVAGQPDIYIGLGATIRRYTYAGDGYVKDSSWPNLLLASSTGYAFDTDPTTVAPSKIHSVHGGGSVRNIYSGHVQDTSEKLWATYDNRNSVDGTHTLDSPASSIAVPTGRFVQVNLPPGSDEIDSAKVYAALSTTGLPADSLLKERLETLTAERTMLIDPSVAGGSGTPPTENTFEGGVAGWLKTQAGGFELYGDGTGDWPLFRDSIIAEILALMPNVKTGFVDITPTVANEWKSAAVTFSGTPFDTPPIVVTGVDSSGTGNFLMQSKHSAATTTGFNAWLRSQSTVARRVVYIAVEL